MSKENVSLIQTDKGLTLQGEGMEIRADFTEMLPRLKQGRLQGEMLVKASRIKNAEGPLTAIDATAGLGQDSILLAAAGFNVIMCEKDEVIAALLQDALKRAEEKPELKEIISRMTLHVGDSIEYISSLDFEPDVIYLDPMFPERQKSALVKKKFQLLHHLEKPCDNEEEMLLAAINAHPRKVIVKRPVKGPLLAGKKPDYSYEGKAIRYDCFAFAK